MKHAQREVSQSSVQSWPWTALLWCSCGFGRCCFVSGLPAEPWQCGGWLQMALHSAAFMWCLWFSVALDKPLMSCPCGVPAAEGVAGSSRGDHSRRGTINSMKNLTLHKTEHRDVLHPLLVPHLCTLLYLSSLRKTSVCSSSTFVHKEMKIYTACQGRANNFNTSWNYLCFLNICCFI